MLIEVDYSQPDASARITFSEDFGSTAKVAALNICRQADPETKTAGRSVSLSWSLALPALIELGSLRRVYGFEMKASPEASTRLARFQKDRRALQAISSGAVPEGPSEAAIATALDARDWDFENRTLKDHQVQGVRKLLALDNGANFSVPGAGKTTMTLAIHLAATKRGTHLLVVCPKNALQAWDDVVKDCQLSGSEEAVPFQRLTGSDAEIRQSLFSGHTRFSINYDLLIRRQQPIKDYLDSHDVHLVLDESHRIKDEMSARYRALSDVSHLPVRRDILTGTPVPHSAKDLKSQLDFLWPGIPLGKRISAGEPPREVLDGLYVRTTKDMLGLPPIRRTFVPVVMGQAQYALYGAIRDKTVQHLLKLRHDDAPALHRAKRSVMRLLQASTNPVAAAQAMLASSEVLDRDQLSLLLNAVIDEGDSQKMLKAVNLARENAQNGRRTVIWSNFRGTISRMTSLLEDLGALDIHGGVPSGHEDSLDTREGRIKKFHQDLSCFVLVANPAACSEGISLHHACHEAIYLDRTYNAGQYLQSLDRIHRLGLAPDTDTNVAILQSVTPQGIASIDYAVARSLLGKIRTMEEILQDADLKAIAFDEEENVENEVFDQDRELEDLRELLEELLHSSKADSYDEEEMG